MNGLLTGKHERILALFRKLDHMTDRLGSLSRSHRPVLDGEHYLTDRELSGRLKISRRTLQEYRNEGRLPYIQLGGKVLYRESDIEKMLRDGQKSVKTVSVPCFILLRPYITVPFRFFPGRIPFSIRCTVRIDRPWTACCRPAGNTCLWFLPKVFRNPCVPFGWLFPHKSV